MDRNLQNMLNMFASVFLLAVGILSFFDIDITWHVVTQTREFSEKQKNLIFFFFASVPSLNELIRHVNFTMVAITFGPKTPKIPTQAIW